VRGYEAINLFGIIFVRRGIKPSSALINHERIHTRQQWELLWVGFYLWYLLEYLFYLIIYRSTHRAYRAVHFEREAYAHERNLNYLQHRRLYAWMNV
jgi:hypothetical protein